MGVLIVRLTGEPDNALSEVESCSDWLFQLGANAVEERADGTELNLVAGFASDDAALAARSVLIERWPCRLESTGDEAAWRDEWMKFIEPVEAGGFVVHAPWHDPASWSDRWPAHTPTLSIDPGRAFGSGHHPTTRLTLDALRQQVVSDSRVLDVGCGTGILSIAAAKLHAATVLGIDLDYDIIEVADANIEANGVADRIELRTDPIDEIEGRYDIVVANIVIGDLTPLMPAIVACADQTVIVSGFLDDQFERLLADVDVTVVTRATLDDWACATLAPVT